MSVLPWEMIAIRTLPHAETLEMVTMNASVSKITLEMERVAKVCTIFSHIPSIPTDSSNFAPISITQRRKLGLRFDHGNITCCHSVVSEWSSKIKFSVREVKKSLLTFLIVFHVECTWLTLSTCMNGSFELITSFHDPLSTISDKDMRDWQRRLPWSGNMHWHWSWYLQMSL